MKKYIYKYWYLMATGHGIEEIISDKQPNNSDVLELILQKRTGMNKKSNRIPDFKLILVEDVQKEYQTTVHTSKGFEALEGVVFIPDSDKDFLNIEFNMKHTISKDRTWFISVANKDSSCGFEVDVNVKKFIFKYLLDKYKITTSSNGVGSIYLPEGDLLLSLSFLKDELNSKFKINIEKEIALFLIDTINNK